MEGGSLENWIFGDDVEIGDDEVNEVGNKIIEPKSGMKFADVDELYEFYRNYAQHMGFPIKKRSYKRGDDGTLKSVTFVCSRAGKSKGTSSNPLKPYQNTQTGCQARIVACFDLDERWQLSSVVLHHNHELNPSEAMKFRCNREKSALVRRKHEINDRTGIDVNKNYNSFVVETSGHENMTLWGKASTSYIEKGRRLRLGEGDVIAIMNYFLKMQAQDTSFFFSMDLDEEGQLKNVFWADGRSRDAYKEFGDVVTFDTIYLRNKYDMPLVLFVGVNHHGQSTLLGCGLVLCEDIETFTWLFQTWLTCMSGCAPNGLITEQDRALQEVIEIVFPNTRHRWCLWHVMKKLPENIGGHKQYDSINSDLQGAVYDSQSLEDFEQSWSVMVDKHSLHHNEWLSLLYIERHRWVPCLVKTSFWAGMQRSDMNSFFDGYVNSKTTLKQFVEQYDNALRSKVEKETQSDFRSFSQLVPCVTLYEMEKQVQKIYTISKFKEFQNELTGKLYCEFISIKEDCMVSEYDIREDVIVAEGKKRMIFRVSFHRDECEVKCSCHMFEFRGILCRHAINVLIRNDIVLIPEKYILRRWRKDVWRCHTRGGTPEQLRYDKMCNAFSKVAKLTAKDEERYIGVMEWINNAKRELSRKREKDGSNHPPPKSSVLASSGNNNNV